MRLIFNLPPVAQARPRMTPKPYMHMYDPANVKAFKRQLGEDAKKQVEKLGWTVSNKAIGVVNIFYRPVQKSLSKAERAKRLSGMVLPTVKQDIDNYQKSFYDALNGIVWKDDAQITDETSKKRYSDRPRIELEVYEINGGQK